MTCARSIYACVLYLLEHWIGIDRTKQLDAFVRFHRKLHLKHPATLADKVSFLSLHGLPPLAGRCTDKWEVRGYVAEKGLQDILIPVYGTAVSSFSAIDPDALPEAFVLKATHGCAMNLFCRDKDCLLLRKNRRMIQRWLHTTYGTFSVEPHYRTIPHRIYCEAYLGSPELLHEYKIHCLNGIPSFILVCSRRKASEVTLDLFDPTWRPVCGLQSYKRHRPGTGAVPKPEQLERMLDIARILSADFAFVRVDLYEVQGRIFFGELTFTPANGVFPSYTDAFLEEMGKKLQI